MNHTSTHAAVDPEAVDRSLRLILKPDQVTELRAFGVVLRGDRWTHKTVSGYFDDPAKLAQAAADIVSATGIYFVPNQVNPALLARAANRIRPVKSEPLTADHDVIRRLYLLIDVDAIRPAGVSATDSEHQAALGKVKEIREWLALQGWPDPILADSGNGGHLKYRIDVPAEDDGLVERTLRALDNRFSDDVVKVDTSVHNPARIWKLPGTLACKGDCTLDRPHRMACIVDVPQVFEVVPADLIEQLADEAPSIPKVKTAGSNGGNSKKSTHRNGKVDLAHWIDQHQLEVTGPSPWQSKNGTGQIWKLNQCQWNHDHVDGSAFIAQMEAGAIVAGCHHNSCQEKGWHELRDVVEPGWRDKSRGAKTVRPEIIPWRPFPVDAFPPAMREFVVETAESIGCDESFVALPILAALAGVIGNTRVILLKRGWVEPAVVWAVIIGESGTTKSPALFAALWMILKRQKAALKAHQEALRQYEQDVMRHEAAVAEWKSNAKKAQGRDVPPPEAPNEPVCERFWVSDITIEALAATLQNAQRGLMLIRDELAGWIKSFDQYKGGRGGDVAHWLTLHGARDLIVDRKGGGTVYVPRAAVSIAGSIQPEIFARALAREHHEDGLAARILPAMPPRRSEQWTESEVPEPLLLQTAELFDALYALQPGIDENNDPTPVVLPLTSEAKRAWIDFHDEHGREQAELSGDLAAAWSKLKGYAARFALILQIARDPASHCVDIEAMTAGIRLSRWFGQETRRVCTVLGESETERDQRKLVELIGRRGGSISARELSHSDRRYRGRADAAEEDLNGLVQAELGVWERVAPGSKGGRPTVRFRLHPVSCHRNPNNSAVNEGFGYGDSNDAPQEDVEWSS